MSYSAKTEDQVIKLYNQGVSIKQIYKTHNISKATIYRWCKKRELPIRSFSKLFIKHTQNQYPIFERNPISMSKICKHILYGKEAREKLMSGIDQLANAVKVTLGPKGRCVVLGGPHSAAMPRTTKDGVSIASDIYLEDTFENMGAQMVKGAAKLAAQAAGDGTTTATLLTQKLVQAGFKCLERGITPVEIVESYTLALDKICSTLNKNSIELDTEEKAIQVATIAANGDSDLGTMIGKTMFHLGSNGLISVQRSHSSETWVEPVEGWSFDSGLVSPEFINDNMRQRCNLIDARILIIDGMIPLRLAASFGDLANTVTHNGAQPLLIVADSFLPQMVYDCVHNWKKNNIPVTIVNAPSHGDERKELLKDLAIFTGGKVVQVNHDTPNAFKKITLDDLGTAKHIHISKNNTTILEGGLTTDNKNKIKEDTIKRIQLLKSHIISTPCDDQREEGERVSKLNARISKLEKGAAIFMIGGDSELETHEKIDRVDDAIQATRAAISGGIVPGGGIALFRARECLNNDDETLTSQQKDVMKEFYINMAAPLRQIISNAAKNEDEIISRLAKEEGGIGYDAANDKFIPMIENGIIDPTSVVKTALEKSISVANMIITTETIIGDISDYESVYKSFMGGFAPKG